ncbi:hypothetical protein GCM10027610_077640 [Dactylosporangium cerinum]
MIGSTGWSAPEALRAEGIQRRASSPVKSLTELRTAADRDPVGTIAASNADRVADLVPIRIGRMISSPFAFLRGSAAVMAADLAAGTADTGLHGYICGDAHAANFGFFASPERRLVMDVNDFDETVVGPWDWDLKRLATSLVSAGREAGLPDDECRDAARDCATGYRTALAELADMPLLDAYYLTTDHSTLEHFGIGDLADTFDRVRKKAKKNTSRRVAQKFTQRLEHDAWRFTPAPPILVPLESADAFGVIESLDGYAATLEEEIRTLFGRYAVVDVAHRIVGLGSVGYRSYVVLLHGNGDEALVLQIKQARASALALSAAGAGPARRRADRARPALDADRQRRAARLDEHRRAALPGPPVPQHEGLGRPDDPARRPARRLRPRLRCRPGPGARPVDRSAHPVRLLRGPGHRRRRRVRRGVRRVRRRLRRPDRGRPRRSGRGRDGRHTPGGDGRVVPFRACDIDRRLTHCPRARLAGEAETWCVFGWVPCWH